MKLKILVFLFLSTTIICCKDVIRVDERSKPSDKKKTPVQQDVKVETPKFTNTLSIPLISSCKDDHTEACLKNTIGDMILNEANKRNISLSTDTLQIGIRFNKDGSISTLNNNTTNDKLKTVVHDVLNGMEPIEPAYFERLNSFETISYTWYIIIKDNNIINRF